jgi:hypothetical protein
MSWLVEDLVEAALGPWALAIGAGVALVMLARRRGAVSRRWRAPQAEAEAERAAARRARAQEAPARTGRAVRPGARARDARGRFVAGPAV